MDKPIAYLNPGRPFESVSTDRLNEMIDRERAHYLRADSRQVGAADVAEYRGECITLLGALYAEVQVRALCDLTADDNATRFYRTVTRRTLLTWLSPDYQHATVVDAWTKARRLRQIQERLAVLDAELCTMVAHDVFEDDKGEDVAGHVAEHLRLLRSK